MMTPSYVQANNYHCKDMSEEPHARNCQLLFPSETELLLSFSGSHFSFPEIVFDYKGHLIK